MMVAWSPVDLPERVWRIYGSFLELIEGLERENEADRELMNGLEDVELVRECQERIGERLCKIHFVYLLKVRNYIFKLNTGWDDVERDELARGVLDEGRRRERASRDVAEAQRIEMVELKNG